VPTFAGVRPFCARLQGAGRASRTDQLAIIDYPAQHPNTFTTEVRKGIDKPHTTVAFTAGLSIGLGLVVCPVFS